MTPWLPTVVLGVIGAVLFFVPNHGKKPSGKRPSLARSLVGLFSEPPPRINLAMVSMSLGWVVGCVSVLLPAAVLGAARAMGDGRARVVLGIGGVVMAAGVVLSPLVMALSVASFGWGGGRLAHPNVMAKVIPIFVGVCAAAAIVLAAWGRAAAWAVGGG